MCVTHFSPPSFTAEQSYVPLNLGLNKDKKLALHISLWSELLFCFLLEWLQIYGMCSLQSADVRDTFLAAII